LLNSLRQAGKLAATYNKQILSAPDAGTVEVSDRRVFIRPADYHQASHWQQPLQ